MNAELQASTPAMPARSVRPIRWLLARELWEHRALYIIPGLIGAILLASLILGLIAGHIDGLPPLDQFNNEATSRIFVTVANLGVASVFAIILPVAWMFYCLDALNAERRDRSILFWKSLPVSDLETVLSKLLTATVVAPLMAFAVMLATQLLVMFIITGVLAANGFSAWLLWTQPAFLSTSIAIFYVLMVISLWYVPVYAYFLLVSAWARRNAVMWAILPAVAIIIIERVAFGTRNFWHLLVSRFITGIRIGFGSNPDFSPAIAFDEKTGKFLHAPSDMPLLAALDPYRFFSSAELWAGLAVAAALIAATVWLRRYREPF